MWGAHRLTLLLFLLAIPALVYHFADWWREILSQPSFVDLRPELDIQAPGHTPISSDSDTTAPVNPSLPDLHAGEVVQGLKTTAIPPHANATGFVLFDNLYLLNGTFFVVTDDPSRFPPLKDLISRPVRREGGN